MSSKIQIKRICAHCGAIFMAKTTVTRYCTHKCNQRAYKFQHKKEKIHQSDAETRQSIMQESHRDNQIPSSAKELVNIKELAVLMNVSESTLFRMIKDDNFPKIKIRRRLVFNKDKVIEFFTAKYGKP